MALPARISPAQRPLKSSRPIWLAGSSAKRAEVGQLGDADAPQQGRQGRDRRPGGEQRAPQRVTQPRVLLAQAQPGVAVARVVLLEQRRRVLGSGEHRRPGLVLRGADVGHRGRCVRPLQAVLLEVERSQHRGGEPERVAGAVDVEHPAVDLARGHRSPDDLGALEDEHVPALVRELGGGDEPVVPGPHDDGVDDLGLHPPTVSAGGRRRRPP